LGLGCEFGQRHDKTWQDQTRQDKARQDKRSQDKTRHNKTRHGKDTKQDKQDFRFPPTPPSKSKNQALLKISGGREELIPINQSIRIYAVQKSEYG
jgi:hypothetical protein